MQARAGNALDGTAVRTVLSQPRSVERTPDWIEPTKVGKDAKSDGRVDAVTKPLSELYFDLEKRTEATVDRSSTDKSSAIKTKTRGIGAQSDDRNAAGQQETLLSAVPDQQPILAVDARALKVFRTLFYTPSVSATPGEVVLTDSLHAMVSVGFEIEKLYGSVWSFQPTKLDVERSIHFHEPHPSAKMGYRIARRVARRVGRRLERAYGWIGGMFVLRENEGPR
ncbi:hypothetical protein LTR85_010906 [Meristemomyces frigidus]|nr:hypothetical protein LTR85_010906 [Meristemomyces frigidus]